MQFGSLSDWVHVILSAVAVYCAVIASKQAERLYRDGKDRERQQEALRRRLEAAKLSVWFGAERDIIKHWGLVLNNVSERPFYSLRIEGKYCGDGMPEEPFDYRFTKVVPPGRFFIGRETEQGTGFFFKLPKVYDDAQFTPLMATKKHIITVIRFTDSDGYRWQTDGKGNLRPDGQEA